MDTDKRKLETEGFDGTLRPLRAQAKVEARQSKRDASDLEARVERLEQIVESLLNTKIPTSLRGTVQLVVDDPRRVEKL